MIVCQLGSWNASAADDGGRLQIDYSPLHSMSPVQSDPHGASLGRLTVVVSLVIIVNYFIRRKYDSEQQKKHKTKQTWSQETVHNKLSLS